MSFLSNLTLSRTLQTLIHHHHPFPFRSLTTLTNAEGRGGVVNDAEPQARRGTGH
jgi:hypothetical protein